MTRSSGINRILHQMNPGASKIRHISFLLVPMKVLVYPYKNVIQICDLIKQIKEF